MEANGRRLAVKRIRLLLIAAASAMLLCACGPEPRKSDAELGLDSQQARGRHIFDRECASCHYAYATRSLRGPSLHGLFTKPYLPSGTPANDDRVRDVVLYGRAKMPGFGRALSPQQLDDLLAYLHTL